MTGTLTNPVEPDDRLKKTEVNGVAEDFESANADESPEGGDDRVFEVGGEDVGEDGEEDWGVDVGDVEIWSPDPLPLAWPVMLARFGAVDAVMEPMVAYAAGFCRAKKGRGDGDSWQQLTCTASALQHHWSLWSEHCVIDSPPPALRSDAC